MHLTHLQELVAYEDRVDRFAVLASPGRIDSARDAINAQAFGFRAHRARDVAVQTSRTFAVISRFNRAIGVISIVASAIFLLCIMLLKVEERRRDVAALRLLGISARTIWRAVVLEASLIALLGSVLGLAFGVLVSRLINVHYQGVYRTPLLFSLLTPGTVLFAMTLSVVLGIGAGGLAARRLTRRPPLSLLGR
jgi:putative ABC transport system permease protein